MKTAGADADSDEGHALARQDKVREGGEREKETVCGSMGGLELEPLEPRIGVTRQGEREIETHTI